jgi:hypothetical protein
LVVFIASRRNISTDLGSKGATENLSGLSSAGRSLPPLTNEKKRKR